MSLLTYSNSKQGEHSVLLESGRCFQQRFEKMRPNEVKAALHNVSMGIFLD